MLKCAPNFRDVAATLPSLRTGILFRSDMVIDPEEQDEPLLAGRGIAVVVDLRSPGERERSPAGWFRDAGVEIATFDVAGSVAAHDALDRLAREGGADAAHDMMRLSYRTFPRGAVSALRFLGERLELGQIPVLVHCTAGKDRTGFVIAILLLAVGLSPELIFADYLASSERKHPRAVEVTRQIMNRILSKPIDEEALARMCGVHADYLNEALSAAAAHSGSLQNYLLECGFDERRVDAIRRLLVQDPTAILTSARV